MLPGSRGRQHRLSFFIFYFSLWKISNPHKSRTSLYMNISDFCVLFSCIPPNIFKEQFYSGSQTSYHFIINTLVYISRGEDFLKNHKTMSQPTKFITILLCHIIVCACSSFPACGKEVFHSWLVQFRIPMKSLHCILFL